MYIQNSTILLEIKTRVGDAYPGLSLFSGEPLVASSYLAVTKSYGMILVIYYFLRYKREKA